MSNEIFSLPQALRNKTVDNYEPQSPHQATALRVVKGIIEKNPEVSAINGLWFYGSTYGTEKTHLQAALYNGSTTPDDKKLWIPPYTTMASYPLYFMRDNSAAKEQYANAECIFIDELTLVNTPVGVVDDLVSLIQQAYGRNVTLYISSNHPLEEVGSRLEKEGQIDHRVQGVKKIVESEVAGRIQSRLSEMVTPIEILGGDYRKILAERARQQVRTIFEEESLKWNQNTSS